MTALISTNTDNIKIIKTIFHWHSNYQYKYHVSSQDCHCLLRIYINESKKRTIVIMSELHSNRDAIDIDDGIADLIKSIILKFPSILGCSPNIIWLTHYGSFSEPLSYTTVHIKDEFSQKFFAPYPDDPSIPTSSVVLSEKQLKKLLGDNCFESIQLEPTAQVLEELGHNNQI